MPGHVPVLFSDVLEQLHLQANNLVIDATLGAGGHARGLLEAIGPNGRLLGFEADPRTLATTVAELSEPRLVGVNNNFRDLATVAAEHGFINVSAILFDLGVSSMTLDEGQRGFSFQHDGPLDMRFDQAQQSLTAADIVNTWTANQLADIFVRYGEIHRPDSLIEMIVSRRKTTPFVTTQDLADAVSSIWRRRGRAHPATTVFQALRIAVNDELGALETALPQAIELLQPAGRLAVITFHSLEDRLVKQWGKAAAEAGVVDIITKHVIAPSREEQKHNPRSRSAKLRIYQKNFIKQNTNE
jgi:16S rRNA (cytosine1402-N4)-methyltransferase